MEDVKKVAEDIKTRKGFVKRGCSLASLLELVERLERLGFVDV